MTKRVNLIPMAGAGQRFLDAGYTCPKPLVPIAGKPMVLRAAASLPPCDAWVFVCRAEHLEHPEFARMLADEFPRAHVIRLAAPTEGQACTCLLAESAVPADAILTIGACDNAMTYDLEKWKSCMSDVGGIPGLAPASRRPCVAAGESPAPASPVFASLRRGEQRDREPRNRDEPFDGGVDALIWTFRRNPAVLQNPRMYGWVEANPDGVATRVSCKAPISANPMNDHAVIGAFSFRSADLFFEAAKTTIAENRRINNEFYVDEVMNTVIRQGARVRVFEVDRYVCWGTPQDVDVYHYWQSYFRKAGME